jgi:hypothetical protein
MEQQPEQQPDPPGAEPAAAEPAPQPEPEPAPQPEPDEPEPEPAEPQQEAEQQPQEQPLPEEAPAADDSGGAQQAGPEELPGPPPIGPSQQQQPDGGGAGGTKRPLEDAEQQAGPEPKRQEQAAPPSGPARELVYRLLVPASKAGLAIGPQGAVAAQIEQDTGSSIKVIEGVPGCDERIVIISSVDDSAQPIPGAQRALFDVHRRCLQSDNPEAAVTTRMLIAVSQAGYIIGKAGRTIGETKDASGAFCKVLHATEVPICGLENDRLLQINGNQLQTAKALQILAEQIRFQPPRDFPGGPVPHLPVFQQQQQQPHGGHMMGGRMGMMPPMGMGMGPGRPPMGPPGGMYGGRPYGGYGY